MKTHFKSPLNMLLAALFIFGISGFAISIQDYSPAVPKVGFKASNVNAFLENPTHYSLSCTSTSKGHIQSAELTNNNEMRITYYSMWEDGDHSGKMDGKYDAKTHRFDGRYQTNDGRFEGEVNFTFNAMGEAKGTWDHGYGTVIIALQQP